MTCANNLLLYEHLEDINYYYFIIFLLVHFLDRNNKINPVIGDIVKVFSPFYKEFFRAKIVEIKGNNYQVFYMDFGNYEQVQLRDIFELSNDFKIKVSYNSEIIIL